MANIDGIIPDGINDHGWIDKLATHLTITYGFLGRTKYEIISEQTWKAESILLGMKPISNDATPITSKPQKVVHSKNLVGACDDEIEYILRHTGWESIEMRFSHFTVTITSVDGGESNCATVVLNYECDWGLLMYKFNRMYHILGNNAWYDVVNDVLLRILNSDKMNFDLLELSKVKMPVK